MFILIVVLKIVELLNIIFDDADEDKSDAHQDGGDRIQDCAFSIFWLEIVLLVIIRQPNMVQRLEAMLDSQLYTLRVNELVNEAIHYISLLKQVPIFGKLLKTYIMSCVDIHNANVWKSYLE